MSGRVFQEKKFVCPVINKDINKIRNDGAIYDFQQKAEKGFARQLAENAR